MGRSNKEARPKLVIKPKDYDPIKGMPDDLDPVQEAKRRAKLKREAAEDKNNGR
jgi:hypothetical protein